MMNWRTVGLRHSGTNSVVFRLTSGRRVGRQTVPPFRTAAALVSVGTGVCGTSRRSNRPAGQYLDQVRRTFFTAKLPCKLFGGSTRAEGDGRHNLSAPFAAIEPGRLGLMEIEPLAHRGHSAAKIRGRHSNGHTLHLSPRNVLALSRGSPIQGLDVKSRNCDTRRVYPGERLRAQVQLFSEP